jgi:hypothetical protein
MTQALPLLSALVLLACSTPKAPKGGDDTGGAGESDGGTDTSSGVGPIEWQDVRLETALTLTSAYASGSGLYVSTETGETWQRKEGAWTELPIDTDGADLNAIWGAGADDAVQLVTVGDGGTVGVWTAGAWVLSDVGTANLESVSGPAQADLMAVGWGGVYVNKNGPWEYQEIEGGPRFNRVWYNGTVAFAVGEEGVHAKKDADGVWTVTQESARMKLYGVSGTKNADMWACGEKGTLLHFDGTTWTPVDLGTELSLWSVLSISETDVWVAGSGGFMAHYDGATWTRSNTGVENNLYHLAYAPSNGSVWAVGNRGMALRFTGND